MFRLLLPKHKILTEGSGGSGHGHGVETMAKHIGRYSMREVGIGQGEIKN